MIEQPTDPSTKAIPFEEIARFPAPGTAFPVQTAFAANERVLTYLYSPDSSLERRLFALELSGSAAASEPVEVVLGGRRASEEELTLEERLRRERAREVGIGITSAIWATDADALLVPLRDGAYVVRGLALDGATHTAERVLDGDDGEIVAPRLSPNGTSLAFVRDGELHVVGAGGGSTPLRLTDSASAGLVNGLAEYVAQEEMGRAEGFWWSPDSALLAYTEVDERHVPPYRIVHQGADEVGPSSEEVHRYPFAGAANARVRLGVVAASGGPTIFMDTGDSEYLVRVHWRDGGALLAELMARDQKSLRLVAFDVESGAGTTLHLETADTYLNVRDHLRCLADGRWLWSSERTGFRHLEVRTAQGALERVLTDGDWQVDNVEAVDEERGLVYFSASKDGPTERHLYVVSLEGGAIRRLTTEAGTHVVVVGPRAGCFVDRFASLETPPNVSLRSLEDARVLATLHDRRDPRIDELGLVPPELVTIEGDDATTLFGLYYEPARTSSAPPPLVVSVYGGPEVQLVTNDWTPTVAMRAQALRRRGVAVLVVDNRGSARRGVAFETAVWRNLGTTEVLDQVRAVAWAAATGRCDPDRVAVYGWSYGGYMALRCLEMAPEVFRAGVAGAPVTDWDGYDTFYTERYMGTPEENRAGYQAASVLEHVAALEGELLLVHGLIDENVHFRHTARLVNKLVRAQKEHRLLCFPDERHLPRSLEDRAYMEASVIGFLLSALGRDDAPTDLS